MVKVLVWHGSELVERMSLKLDYPNRKNRDNENRLYQRQGEPICEKFWDACSDIRRFGFVGERTAYSRASYGRAMGRAVRPPNEGEKASNQACWVGRDRARSSSKRHTGAVNKKKC